MYLIKTGYNHRHNADFFVNRPNGSGDYLALLITSDAVITKESGDIPVMPTAFFLYHKGTPQYYRASGSYFSNDWFHFDFDEGDSDTFFAALNIPFETPLPIGDPTALSVLIKDMTYEQYAGHAHSNALIHHLICTFFLKLSGMIAAGENASEAHNDKISLLRSQIYNQPYFKWTVESLAMQINLSASYFEHLYKRQFGISCIDDVITARIEYAKYHLRQTGLTVKDVAALCGYENDVHFMRQFKKSVGITPTDYRKSLNQ